MIVPEYTLTHSVGLVKIKKNKIPGNFAVRITYVLYSKYVDIWRYNLSWDGTRLERERL